MKVRKDGMNLGLEGWDRCRFGRIGWMWVWKEGMEGWDGCWL